MFSEQFSSLSNRLLRVWGLLYHSKGSVCLMRNLHPPYPIRAGENIRYLHSADNEESRGLYSEVVLFDAYGISNFTRENSLKKIVDIGANIGTFSLFASALFPEAEIAAFEPHPEVFSHLRKNCTGLKVSAYNVAVSNTSGKASFDANTKSVLSSLSPQGTVSVETIPAEEIFKGEEIDFLKMDCEGAEFRILEDGRLLERCLNMGMEYHLDATNNMQLLQALINKGKHVITKIIPSPSPEYGILWTQRFK